jgi:hypothetical protein
LTRERTNGDRDDISEAELAKKLLRVGGAHTPEYYDFGGGAQGRGRRGFPRKGSGWR